MNRSTLLLVPALLGFLGLSASALPARTINIAADPYMPYTGDSEKGETGFMVDIAKAIWEKKGHTVSYQSMQWKEAVSEARSGLCTAIVGADRDDAPDFLYPKTEQGQALGGFFVTAASGWKYGGPDSLDKICLGVISDYKYSPEIASYIQKNAADQKKLFMAPSSADLLGRFVQLVRQNRIQAFVEDENVVQYFMKSYDRPDTIVESGTLKSPTKLYIALSPHDLDKEQLAQDLDDGMAALRASGELDKILSKYGLTDWAAGADKAGKGGKGDPKAAAKTDAATP